MGKKFLDGRCVIVIVFISSSRLLVLLLLIFVLKIIVDAHTFLMDVKTVSTTACSVAADTMQDKKECS